MAAQPEQLRDWSVSDAKRGLNLWVFIPSVVIILVALVFATYWGNAHGAEAFETLNTAIVDTVGWWYVLICTGFVFFALWAGVSKVGNIRLGRDDEKPEFSMFAWFCMLFAAGMGIGLVFWGVAEPLWHFIAPPRSPGKLVSMLTVGLLPPPSRRSPAPPWASPCSTGASTPGRSMW